jgi:hypothetical protein
MKVTARFSATFRFLRYGQVFDALDLSGQVAALTAVSIQEIFFKKQVQACALCKWVISP